MAASIKARRAGAPLLNDPRLRGLFWQAVAFAALVAFLYWVVGNTVANLARANIASGFGFLKGRAGFDISSTPIAYSSDSTYARAVLVGLLNTLNVAVLGVVTASVIGFLVGVGRLSRNWLVRKICMVYVEIFRNIPPLLVIFFWYFGVLSVLPQARESIALPFGTYVNNRGVFMPAPVWGERAWTVALALAVGVLVAVLLALWARRLRRATGRPFPTLPVAAALVVVPPVAALVLAGFPLSFDFPKLGTFNLSGGAQVRPEFLSLYLALSFYTAAFIAEIVRGGVLAVGAGQTEAAYALGLRPRQTMRLVVVPQALRVIIPPLSSQYLNLTKNSSLAIAIGYPDLVAVGGTILNQTGQSVEVVALWMAIYLAVSLATSGLMNWFNARMALVER